MVSVADVGRVAHRQNSFGSAREFLRHNEVFDKGDLNVTVSRKILLGLSGKVAVAKPTCALTRGAIHEYVKRVLSEGFNSRRKYFAKTLVVRIEAYIVAEGIAVFAHSDLAYRDLAFGDLSANILEGIRLKAFKDIFSGEICDLYYVADLTVAVEKPAAKGFGKGEINSCFFFNLELCADKSRAVAGQTVNYVVTVFKIKGRIFARTLRLVVVAIDILKRTLAYLYGSIGVEHYRGTVHTSVVVVILVKSLLFGNSAFENMGGISYLVFGISRLPLDKFAVKIKDLYLNIRKIIGGYPLGKHFVRVVPDLGERALEAVAENTALAHLFK